MTNVDVHPHPIYNALLVINLLSKKGNAQANQHHHLIPNIINQLPNASNVWCLLIVNISCFFSQSSISIFIRRVIEMIVYHRLMIDHPSHSSYVRNLCHYIISMQSPNTSKAILCNKTHISRIISIVKSLSFYPLLGFLA